MAVKVWGDLGWAPHSSLGICSSTEVTIAMIVVLVLGPLKFGGGSLVFSFCPTRTSYLETSVTRSLIFCVLPRTLPGWLVQVLAPSVWKIQTFLSCLYRQPVDMIFCVGVGAGGQAKSISPYCFLDFLIAKFYLRITAISAFHLATTYPGRGKNENREKKKKYSKYSAMYWDVWDQNRSITFPTAFSERCRCLKKKQGIFKTQIMNV